MIDGKRVFADHIGGNEDSQALDQGQIQAVEAIKDRFRHVRVPVKAGVRMVGAAFVARSFAEGDYLLQSLVPGEGAPLPGSAGAATSFPRTGQDFDAREPKS